MTSTITGTSSTSSSSSSSSATASTTTDTAAQLSSSFLTMLTTQLQNQDPLNPADNSQITSQMAQINTVTGVNQLNTTMTAMSANMTQMQMMQGASLVGHQVLLPGNQITVGSTGTATVGYNLASSATNVTIKISDAAGNLVDTVNQTGVAAGQQGFQWTPPTGASTSGLTFSVTATGGGKTIAATPLMTDKVDAISTTNGSLNLELQNSGTTAYSKIVAVS